MREQHDAGMSDGSNKWGSHELHYPSNAEPCIIVENTNLPKSLEEREREREMLALPFIGWPSSKLEDPDLSKSHEEREISFFKFGYTV